MSQKQAKTDENESKTAQNDEKRVTSEYILDILAQFGPSARILIVAPDMTQMEHILLNDDDGMLNPAYGRNFSGNWRFRQMTHRAGGTIYLATYRGILHHHQIDSLYFTHVWLENPPMEQVNTWDTIVHTVNDRMKRPDDNFMPLVLVSQYGKYTPEG